MLLGSEVFLSHTSWVHKVKNRRVGFLGHQASLNKDMSPTLSRLLKHPKIHVNSVFSPQHGFRGTKQANMIPSRNSTIESLPLFSLYSEKTRRLTKQMKKTFDVLIIDLQDMGCRIYTYLTTVFYMLEDCEEIIILDRPNPIGRDIEGSLLKSQYKSFVGHGPLPMAHGLTLGEAALWFKEKEKLKVSLQIVPMKGYSPKAGWPKNRPWVQPSPNMTDPDCAKCYPGTVLLEGTEISEGRGTTLPFQVFGKPHMKRKKIKKLMEEKGKHFLKGCALREHDFEPVFDKFKGKTCQGFQVHLEPLWVGRGKFRPYRLISCFLKCFYTVHPEFPWKKSPPYEYEYEKLPIDILSGGKDLRKWIESPSSTMKQWDDYLKSEETLWEKERKPFLIYK